MKFVLLDSDYTYARDNSAAIRLYGKILDGVNEGKNVVVHVLGMEPYFYCDNAGLNIYDLQKRVETVLKGFIKRTEIVMKYRPIGYQINKVPMLKIVLFNPKATPEAREALKKGIPEISASYIYEADIPYANRWMVDNEICGMDIIYINEEGKELKNYGLNCDKLLICTANGLKVLKDEMLKIEY